ncbi:Toll/interleukin-1 receptor-like proteiny [Sesbania bispinosa]|nr:Toll/interleukin-1 receptor-like proteiny [Sesbania bispinosa]
MQRSLAMNLIQRRFLSQQKRTQMLAKRVMEPCDVFLNHRSTDTKRTINGAVLECKIGVAVFSPRYCESYFCLHELDLLMACRKKVIPIFCDVKPSQLRVVNNPKWSGEDLRRFRLALEEAKNLSEIVTSASDIIIGSMIELENEEHMEQQNLPIAL